MLTSALRSRDFRLLWTSQTVSTLGDALILVAVGLYVTRLTGSPTDVGLVLGSYSLPLVGFLLIGGVVADRLPRQRLMVATDLVRALAHGILAVLILTDAVRIWNMMIIGVVFAIAEAFFRPAYTGLIPQTIGEADIQSAQAIGGLSREIASFLSPALATGLVLGVGGAAAFALDSLTFVVSALLLWRVRTRERGPVVASRTPGVLSELREGWAAVRQRGWVLWTIVAFTAALPLALAPFEVLGATLAREVYGSEAVFGFANAAWGVGTVTGVLIGSRWSPQRPMLVSMASAIPWGGALALYAAGPPVALVYLAMASAGVCLGLCQVLWETALAQRIPPHLLSRVSAWDWMGSLAFLPIGYIVAGPIAHLIGDVRLLVWGGILASAASALGLLPRSTRTLRRADDPDGPAGFEPVPGPVATVGPVRF
jgi:MFS family permease